MAGVVLDAQGDLFGATTSGGAFNDGTVFELSPVPEPASLVLLGLGM
ncbi:MAG: PEP-CTERM sorting domain-containing protein, partial [Planctomycetaceae bacterium]|nr:PEP-CTERM sorting domain-containing protein [Planctomycetaceae bacterium]